MRWIWWAALVAGISYTAGAWTGWDSVAMIAWKAAGVGLLALWAAVQARGTDGWLIAAVMALSALGDGVLDAAGLVPGALFFLAAHGVAIILYARNRRPVLSRSQKLLARVIAPLTVLIAVLCSAPMGQELTVGFYAIALGTMASFAWASRFPRYRTGLGAMLFVASDLLIFSRMGPLSRSLIPDLLVWPLYFAGQAMIAWGVVATLREQAWSGADQHPAVPAE